MAVIVVGSVALVSLVVGWVAGMWTRARSNLWCSGCGRSLRCFHCVEVAGAGR
jgi:hypothetical protein